MQRLIAVPIIIIGILLSVGCVPPGVEQTRVEFCQALDNYREVTAQVQEITEGTTVAELADLGQHITTARQDLFEAGTALQEARMRYAESAWQDLEKQIGDVPGETTLGDAAPFLRGQVDVLLTEIDRVNNVSCERR